VLLKKISIPTQANGRRDYWKFQGGGGGGGGGEGSKAKFLKKSIRVNWDFQRGWRVKPKQPLKGGAGAFSGTTHCNKWTVL